MSGEAKTAAGLTRTFYGRATMECAWCHRDGDPDDPDALGEGPYLCPVCTGLLAPLLGEDGRADAERYSASMRWIGRAFCIHDGEADAHTSDACWWCGRDGDPVEVAVCYETEEGWPLRYADPVLCSVCEGLLLLGQLDPVSVACKGQDALRALAAAIACEE